MIRRRQENNNEDMQKNAMFKKKKGSKTAETETDVLQYYSTNNKAIFVSIHKQFWQFPVRQHCINHFYHRKGK